MQTPTKPQPHPSVINNLLRAACVAPVGVLDNAARDGPIKVYE